MNRAKIVFLITGLNLGGAETMLYKLLCGYKNSDFEITVISLMDKGVIGREIEKLGITIYALNVRKNFKIICGCIELVKILKKIKPQIICSWMYHANFVSFFAKLFIKNAKLIWNIRQTNVDASTLKFNTRVIAKLCAWFSPHVDKIIYCAKSAARVHEKFGYSSVKTIVIPNGFDLAKFQPNYNLYTKMRQDLNLPAESFIVGICARYHLVKDYTTFFQAAKLIAEKNDNVYFVCCGRDVSWLNQEIIGLLDNIGIKAKVFLLGECHNMEELYPAFDVLASSSIAEGFSNVIGEAMACGVPCVATNVGDSATIVGDSKYVVPSKEPRFLADAVLEILNLEYSERKKISEFVRHRIEQNYSIDSIVKEYQKLFMSVI